MKKILIAFLLIASLLLSACNMNAEAPSGGSNTNDETTVRVENPTASTNENATDGEDETTSPADTTTKDNDVSQEDDTTARDEDATTSESNDGTTATDEDGTTNEENTTSAPQPDTDSENHKDSDNNGYCDDCGVYVIVTVDFYSITDLHGKFEDSDSQPGVYELNSYLKGRRDIDDFTVFLSAGDMWQGGTASNGTKGKIMTDWMNHLGFDAMTLGNHEFDWGQDAIKANVAIAEFPILAINIYDDSTGQRVEYCKPSVMIERGGAKIGIIGAMGDCYSSISAEMTRGIHFKTGSQLTSLIKAESQKLRELGADIIVYLIHDGTSYRNVNVNDYYDISLSSGGYVDVVFGGHSHSYYITRDAYGVPHLQGGGDNSKGMTHVEVNINYANEELVFTATDYVEHRDCASLEDDPIVQQLLSKYWSEIGWMYDKLGYNSSYRDGDFISNLAAELYLEAGIEKWGDKYDIVLAGGSINTRSPYELNKGYIEYGDLQMVLPFDNPLYLCSIKGSDLISFMNRSGYYIASNITSSQINRNATYYIIADSWTALYAPAKCTPVELYDETTFARDLIAKYIMAGGLE